MRTRFKLHTERPLKLIENEPNKNLLLDQYIMQLNERLFGLISDDERESYLNETRIHLDQSVRGYCEDGMSELEATEKALKQYGPAKSNAEDYLESWFQFESQTPMTRKFGRANLISYGLFQMAVVAYLIFLQVNVFIPAESTYHIPWSPAKVREVWPDPLPFPDFTWQFMLTVIYPIIVPFLVGWTVGKMVPVRAHIAAYHGLLPMIMISVTVGALLLPSTQGLLFALFQIVFWLPAGCMSASLSSHLAHLKRARHAQLWEADDARSPETKH